MPPTTQGFVALEMLKILEGFDLTTMGANAADALHAMIEAKKLAFADRDRHLADRDFMKIDVRELFAAERAERLRGLIRMDQAAANIRDVRAARIPSMSPPQIARAISFHLFKATSWVSVPVSSSRTPGSFCRTAAIFFLSMKITPTASAAKRCVHTLMPG